MPDDQITDAKDLLKRVSDFGASLRERRRFERKRTLWAATVEVHGQRFEGMIVDLSPGGARIKFDAAVAAGDELTLVLKQLDELGAKVVWQREGEAGLQFLLAPDDVAAKIQGTLVPDPVAPPAAGDAPAAPAQAPAEGARRRPAAAPRPDRRLLSFAFIGLVGLGAALSAGMLISDLLTASPPPAAVVLADDQHSCSNLMDKVGGAANQLDFSLSVASAAQAKCLDIHHLAPTETDANRRMLRTTRVPLQ